jgi:hypothetical protein
MSGAVNDHRIAALWRQGRDTYDIARIVGVREAEVANRLLAARSLVPRRPPSLTSTVCGDPLPGRSALDRPRDQRTMEEGPL